MDNNKDEGNITYTKNHIYDIMYENIIFWVVIMITFIIIGIHNIRLGNHISIIIDFIIVGLSCVVLYFKIILYYEIWNVLNLIDDIISSVMNDED